MKTVEFVAFALLACVILRACGAVEPFGNGGRMVGAVCPPDLGPQHARKHCVALYDTAPYIRPMDQNAA